MKVENFSSKTEAINKIDETHSNYDKVFEYVKEKVAKYEQGQGMAKGLVSTIATIGAVTGVMAAGIVTTPFTGGASLAGSLAACGAILGTGAAVSVAINSSDALTSDAKDYSLKQAGKDMVKLVDALYLQNKKQ